MPYHYSNPKRANVETFYRDSCFVRFGLHCVDGCDRTFDTCNHVGWYWQACFPGCLPDSDPSGPFATEAEALADALEGMTDDTGDSCRECGGTDALPDLGDLGIPICAECGGNIEKGE
jgi:hypothetical protein